MLWSEHVKEIVSVATAVLLSIGGSGTLLLALASWLGKFWASRILEREKADLNKSIEATKADLTRSIEREKAVLSAFLEEHRSELQQLSSARLDALNRRRDVYARLATKLRILLRAGIQANSLETDKSAFLAAYDESYIWASEAVADAIRDLIETLQKKAGAEAKLGVVPLNAPGYQQANATVQTLGEKAQSSYQNCLLQMRKDCGFPQSNAEYLLVSF